MSTAYDEVATKLREINTLEGIGGLIGWDEMVMLPSGSSDSRAAQKTVLAGVLYDKKTDSTLGSLLDELAKEPAAASLSQVQHAVVRDARKQYIRDTALPKDLVTRMAQLETDGYNAWIESRQKKDFKYFSPILQEWVDANIAKAKYIDPTGSPYDILLDQYEKGMTTQRIDEIFTEVRKGLVPLISEIMTKGTPPDSAWLAGTYDTDVQAKLVESIALDIGFDITKGRLDVSVHPFTGGAHPRV